MCGITGFLSTRSLPPGQELAATVGRMGLRLAHRGPDSSGLWVDEACGVAMAHQRLAILDLTPDGAQPMHSESGRFVVTFNGEIYNYAPLRDELAALGHAFRGSSDTEVLLAAAEQWGLEAALERFNGMFAFGLWDREQRLLHLARDRMGEKPLYFGWFGGLFLFGSELKAVRAHPGCGTDVDRDALALFMRHGYVPGPYSIHVGLRKLAPGSLLTVSPARPGGSAVTRYWSHQRAAARGAAMPFEGGPEEAVAAFESLLREAVKMRMQADVPLGAFLSGGLDSSTIVALMQAQSSTPVKTFTIGFREDGFDEAGHARAVAAHLGTDHTELYLGVQDALDVIPRLPELYDEPFADSSQIPTFLVSQLARRHVTVSLSGDGGDELLCGYTRYAKASALWSKLRWVPSPLRALLGRSLRAIPGALWRRALGDDWADRVDARAEILQHRSPMALYRGLLSLWQQPTRLVLGAREPSTPFMDPGAAPRLSTFTDEMMFLDALCYLPDDILVKLDRATMGVSLESRVPLLDHRLVELAWRLPLSLKRRAGESKWILRQILHRYVPMELVDRPKMGFSVPIEAWLRGPLRPWAEELLAPERLRREGYLDPAPVQAALRAHLSGERHRPYHLWNVLMFQSWLAKQQG